jgi:hypothetical protein
MKAIDAVIDSEPTTKRIIDLADLRNRNLLSFKELKTYNDTGTWLNKHPLLEHFSIRFQLRELLDKKPDEFLDEFTKTSGYVSRYKSYLNNSKRTEEEHANDKKNLGKHAEKEQIMRELLNESRQ